MASSGLSAQATAVDRSESDDEMPLVRGVCQARTTEVATDDTVPASSHALLAAGAQHRVASRSLVLVGSHPVTPGMAETQADHESDEAAPTQAANEVNSPDVRVEVPRAEKTKQIGSRVKSDPGGSQVRFDGRGFWRTIPGTNTICTIRKCGGRLRR